MFLSRNRVNGWTWARVVVVVVGTTGCTIEPGDDDTSSTPTPEVATPTPRALVPTEGAYTLSGTIAYEFVPYDMKRGGLDYDGTFERPIRGAYLYLLDALEGTEVASLVVGDDGAYAFSWDGTNYVKLRVYAQTETPSLRVEDNTHQDAVWVVDSEMVDALETSAFDYVATTGWAGSSYRGERAAAPFAILDAAYTAARRFLDETHPPPDFPALHINWSPANSPVSGDVTQGQISTSHWDSEELYILGKADLDTDEFDTHITVHEWGHYFESKISRSDSVGGGHTTGDVLDPRVAFGEGWGNGLSAMILDPDSVYTDSYGNGQKYGFEFDMEENVTSSSHHPGWYSEESLQAILYDLYDGANETHDNLELGLDPIYQVLIGDYKETDAYTTVFSFIAHLKALYPEYADQVDEIVTYHTADGNYGIDPIQDDWGTGETHDGGVDSALPLYLQASIGDTITFELQGGEDANKLAQNRYIVFAGNGELFQVQTTCSEDVDIFIQEKGEYVAWAMTTSGNEVATLRSGEGVIYVANIRGYSTKPGAYSVTFEFLE